MAIVNVVDETSFKSQRVFSNGAARGMAAFNYYALPSASATGSVATSAGVLHSIIFQSSATAATYLWLFDCAGASAGAIGTSASAVARFDLTSVTRGTYLFDAIFNGGLRYRLSGAEGCDGITVTYSLAS